MENKLEIEPYGYTMRTPQGRVINISNGEVEKFSELFFSEAFLMDREELESKDEVLEVFTAEQVFAERDRYAKQKISEYLEKND